MGARDAGFTLLEALVALAITGLALATLLPMALDNASGVERAVGTRIAVAHAESALAALGTAVPLRLGETAGSFGDGYRWRLQVAAGPDLLRDTPYQVTIYDVVVTVAWGDDARPQTISLRTLRFGPKL